MKIKFIKDGLWQDDPSKLSFSVKAGDVLEVSERLASLALKYGAAEKYEEKKDAEPVKAKSTPYSKDKAKAES